MTSELPNGMHRVNSMHRPVSGPSRLRKRLRKLIYKEKEKDQFSGIQWQNYWKDAKSMMKVLDRSF